MSNDIAITSQPGATVGTAAAIFSPEGMNQLVRFAELMSQSKATVPKHLEGKPADCLAVTMQAAQWGMNPFRRGAENACGKRNVRLRSTVGKRGRILFQPASDTPELSLER